MADPEASIVLITGTESGTARFGTGFVIGHDESGTLIVTCAHVLRDVGGPELARIGGLPLTLVAADPEGWPDLAVLRISPALTVPALAIGPGAGQGDIFDSAGFHTYGGQHLIRRLQGRLGQQLGVENPHLLARVAAWELVLDGEDRLQPGYSGAPVLDHVRGCVTGVVSHREGEGRKGLALDITALRRVWPGYDEHLAMQPVPAAAPRRDGITLDLVCERTSLFVDRVVEFGVLTNKLSAALRGDGATGLVVGEAGTGKSTLILRLIRELFEERSECVFALARIDIISGTNTSYAPFRSVMEQLLASEQTAVTEDGRTVRPVDLAAGTLRDLGLNDLGPFAVFTGVATDMLQRRLREGTTGEHGLRASADQGMLFDCYAGVVLAVSRYFPLVILLDDIHWVDDSSLLLLQHLARLVEFHKVLVVATLRPEEAAASSMVQQVQDQLGASGAFCIDLTRRDPGATRNREFCRQYLNARYGTEVSEHFVDFLSSLTGGNPLFLSETLTNLEENGQLIQLGGTWSLRESVDALDRLPTRVEHIISQRVNRLDETLLDILKYGSVEGEIFTAEVVARLRGVEDRELLRTVIEKLMRVHRLVVAGATRRLSGRALHTFGFRHVLTQRYVYEYVLSEIEREMFHEELATCLESLWGEAATEIAPQLATHYSLAGMPEKTIEYALLAGVGLLRQYGWSEATKFGRLGLRMLANHPTIAQELPAETQVRLRLLHAKGELEGGVPGELVDHVQAGTDTMLPCLNYLDQIDPALAAEVYLTLGKLEESRTVPADSRRSPYLDEAIRIAERTSDKRLLLDALMIYNLNTNVADQSSGAAALAVRRRCVELAEDLGDVVAVAKSLSDLAMHYIVFDTDDEQPLARAEEHAHRALALAATQNVIAELNASLILGWVYHHQGYYGTRLETHRRELLALAHKHGQTIIEAEARTDLAHYYSFVVGFEDEALRLMQEAYEFRTRIGRPGVHDSEHFAGLLFRLGRFEECRQMLERILDLLDSERAARTQRQFARVLAISGHRPEATAILADLDSDPAIARTPDPSAMMAYATLGNTATALRIAEQLGEAVPAAGRRGQFWTYWDLPSGIAEVYRLAGDLEAAQRWAETAVGYWRDLAERTDVKQLVMYWEHELVRGKVLADLGRDDAGELLDEVSAALKQCRHYALPEALHTLDVVRRRGADG